MRKLAQRAFPRADVVCTINEDANQAAAVGCRGTGQESRFRQVTDMSDMFAGGCRGVNRRVSYYR